MDLEVFLSTLSAPAQRGIQSLGLAKLEDFTAMSEDQVRSLPGVGPKTASRIKDALVAQGLAFQSWTAGKTVLTDPTIYPDDNQLRRHLGETKVFLDRMVDELRRCEPPISVAWRYYTDGNSWLGKATAGNKTILWVTICHHMFKATCYFNVRALALLERSGLGDEYRRQWKEIEKTGKTKSVTVEVNGPRKLDHVLLLVHIKRSLP